MQDAAINHANKKAELYTEVVAGHSMKHWNRQRPQHHTDRDHSTAKLKALCNEDAFQLSSTLAGPSMHPSEIALHMQQEGHLDAGICEHGAISAEHAEPVSVGSTGNELWEHSMHATSTAPNGLVPSRSAMERPITGRWTLDARDLTTSAAISLRITPDSSAAFTSKAALSQQLATTIDVNSSDRVAAELDTDRAGSTGSCAAPENITTPGTVMHGQSHEPQAQGMTAQHEHSCDLVTNKGWLGGCKGSSTGTLYTEACTTLGSAPVPINASSVSKTHDETHGDQEPAAHAELASIGKEVDDRLKLYRSCGSQHSSDALDGVMGHDGAPPRFPEAQHMPPARHSCASNLPHVRPGDVSAPALPGPRPSTSSPHVGGHEGTRPCATVSHGMSEPTTNIPGSIRSSHDESQRRETGDAVHQSPGERHKDDCGTNGAAVHADQAHVEASGLETSRVNTERTSVRTLYPASADTAPIQGTCAERLSDPGPAINYPGVLAHHEYHPMPNTLARQSNSFRCRCCQCNCCVCPANTRLHGAMGPVLSHCHTERDCWHHGRPHAEV